MFRGTQKTALDTRNFGAGSFVLSGRTRYLVVANANSVKLLDLSTFCLLSQSVIVEDPNFISEEECRTLVGYLDCAFSDCDYEPAGLKKLDISKL